MLTKHLKNTLSFLALILWANASLYAQFALRFDGEDDYVQFANQSAYNFDSFTMEAWVFLPDNPGVDVVVISNMDNFGNGVQWGINSNGNQTLTIQGQQAIEPNINLYDFQECTHIAVTYDEESERVSFYVNGSLVFQDILPNVTATASDLWLGAEPSSFSMFYYGGMDEVRIWGIALSEDEVSQWYLNNCPDNYGKFLLYADFDEDPASQIVHDFSPIANHGFRGAFLTADVSDPVFVEPFCEFKDCCEVEAFFSGPVSAAVGTPVTYINASISAIAYEWYVDGVLSATTTNFNTAFTTGGLHVVTLKAIGSEPGCFDFYSLVVEVEGNPCDAGFTFTIDCNTVNFFSNSTQPGLSHTWFFGDGGSSTQVNPTHLYLGTGTYTVTHIVSFGESCMDTVVLDVEIDCFDDPCLDDCNIVPWGDFESQNIYSSIPLYAHNDLWLTSLVVPIANSVDLYNSALSIGNSIDNGGIINQMLVTNAPIVPAASGGGDQYVAMAASRSVIGSNEYLTREILSFELCEPILPGQVYDVSILLQLYVGSQSDAVFRIQGSEQEACAFWTQGDLAVCSDEGCNVMCNGGNSYTPYDIAAYYPLNGSWTTHSSVYEHPATAPPLNYIVIFPEVPCPETGNVYVLADNVSICPSSATAGTPVVPNPNIDANFTFTVSSTNCPEVTFTPVTTSGTHTWDFGDANTSTAVSPTHVYASQGTYTVIHTVTDGDDCFSSEVMTVEVDCKGCQVDPWPKIYETTGPFSTRASVLGLEFDTDNNVYTLRNSNYSYALTLPSATSYLTKYCEDGEELWSVELNGAELTAYEPNTRLAVDDNGNSYVLVAYENSMIAAGTTISNTGTNLAILRFDDAGTLLNWRSIPYTLPGNIGFGRIESIKVSGNGSTVFVLLNDRIKQINPVSLLDVTDELGVFHSIDISDNGGFIYFVNNAAIGFYAGLGTTPVTMTPPTWGLARTDLEYDEANDRLYLGSAQDVYVYDVTSTSISANSISPMVNVFNSERYHEIHPTPGGLLIYNVDQYYGVLPFDGIDYYNLAGVQQWNLPINGQTAPRSSIMMGFNNNLGYLGAMWWDQLTLGWYSTPVNSGSFVTRFDLTGTMVSKTGSDEASFEDASDALSGGVAAIQLYPNPTDGRVELAITTGDVEAVNVTVIDAYGQVVLQQGQVAIQNGKGLSSLDLTSQPAGMYFIVVESDGARVGTERLILR